MNFKTVLTKLYFLLVHADGIVNEREIAIASQMTKAESIDEKDFSVAIEALKKRNAATIYFESIEELKKLDHQRQVRCVAWLCVIANADGFMDKGEWQFIYKIYHKELGLNLDDVMKTQKELIGLAREKSSHFLAVL
ncbi:MAG: TerB family tellurite resistance protein [Cyclobacteriaceae bacterium]